MTFINNVSHESENKTTASILFVNLFHFTQKSKQAFYSGLALKNLPNRTLSQVGFFAFLNFLFFKAAWSNYGPADGICAAAEQFCTSLVDYRQRQPFFLENAMILGRK